MKILIVGGTGLLSGAVTELAIKRNIEVFMLNRGNRLNRIPGKAHLLKADIHDSQSVLPLIKNLYFDTVLDFICYNEKDLENSLALLGDKTKQFIFISSYAVYDTLACNECDEESPKWLETPSIRQWKYGINKQRCEELLKRTAAEKHIAYTIIRPAVTYGNTRIPYGIAPALGYHGTIIERILHRKPLITWNNGENKCNITHVDDFSVGVVGLLGNPRAYNEIFNIAGDETPSWKEVLETLAVVLNVPLKMFDIPVDYYAGEIMSKDDLLGGRSISSKCSNKKIKSIVDDFKQTISLEDGLKQTVDFYFEHKQTMNISYGFDGETDRIIAKYAKTRKVPTRELGLHFVDYRKKNNIKDKLRYIMQRSGGAIMMRKMKSLFESLVYCSILLNN